MDGRAAPRSPEQEDTLISQPSYHWKFNIKQFIEFGWARGEDRRWRVGFGTLVFLPILVQHALPVDSPIQTRGILIASRCRCCRNHEVGILKVMYRVQLLTSIDRFEHYGDSKIPDECLI